ncbi:VanZ family protein [Arthrobacter sp. MA-N2]|uniref:VanZ family protein n=1 Tax=Arthrobacter sp. MA-N2 TaxID=1101188 RepID=UPI0004AD759A|nr:VanZ family protein [Arthrobacter sp. MA-N2]
MSPLIAIGLIGAVGIGAASMYFRRPARVGRRVALALGWFWASVVFYATLASPSGGGSVLNLVPLDLTNPLDLKDFVLNVLLFLPGGVFLGIWGMRWTRVLVLGCGTSMAIEITQYVTASGRTADINDVLANTTGALIGFLLVAGVRKVVHRMRGTKRQRISLRG